MGVVAGCDNCKELDRYDSGEIYELLLGSWYVNCSKCENPILINSFDMSTSSIEYKKGADPEDRARKSDIKEYWIQQYFKENYHSYSGFSDLEGPFDTGPDFRGKINGEETYIEIERDCSCYLKHKHHLDKRFDKVSALVVLSRYDKDEELEPLPKYIVYLDIPDFVQWFKPRAKEYAIKKQQMHVVNRLGNYFKTLYVKDCSDKERDMAVCPNCELCPYFGEGMGEGWTAFQEIAGAFIAFNGIGKSIEEKFDIGKMDPNALYGFYFDYAEEFLF